MTLLQAVEFANNAFKNTMNTYGVDLFKMYLQERWDNDIEAYQKHKASAGELFEEVPNSNGPTVKEMQAAMQSKEHKAFIEHFLKTH